MLDTLSHLGLSVQASSLMDKAVDSPAVGHTFAFAIALTAFMVIGGLLFFWRWNRARYPK